MKLARVIGNVVSTIKTYSHQGYKLMIVQPVDDKGNDYSDSFIAVDCAQAGVGDIVLVVEEGGSAREVMKHPEGAVNAVIVGIIDNLDS
jgi:microcompartment protein CcmK/EutM